MEGCPWLLCAAASGTAVLLQCRSQSPGLFHFREGLRAQALVPHRGSSPLEGWPTLLPPPPSLTAPKFVFLACPGVLHHPSTLPSHLHVGPLAPSPAELLPCRAPACMARRGQRDLMDDDLGAEGHVRGGAPLSASGRRVRQSAIQARKNVQSFQQQENMSLAVRGRLGCCALGCA